MNEDFVRQFKKQPDSQLVEKIHLRLEKKERTQTIKRYSMLSGLALFFVFGMLMTFSSTVRADVINLIKEIAGLQYEVTVNYPGGSEKDVTIIEPEYLSLEEARSRFPAPIQLPTYVPQRYERLADMQFYIWSEDSSTLTIIWEKREEDILVGMISLNIAPCPSSSTSCGMIVGEGALEEIALNGKPAAVVRGGWNYDTKEYDLSLDTAIQWRYDENTVYRISSYAIPLEELIKIAESIP